MATSPTDIEDLEWFHKDISRHVAEGLLMANGVDGSYLLRTSTTKPGDYSLSVRCANSVKHISITWDGREYAFGMGRFKTLRDFAEHFENKPLIGGESGVLTLLKYPYPRTVDEPPAYETVRVHAEWGRTSSDETPAGPNPAPTAIASKEGYLTKMGGHRKNWLTRWFVLVKNELRYYRARGDSEPLRALDLQQATEVARDTTHGKTNCMRLVFPGRTFFMFAGSAQEADEWIGLLQWKLDQLRKGQGTMQF
ncbi:dual adapter for phosphotyrosine and 3-phosphotyrosine and 3-phosphoinositide-like [Sycon ciliatum]|uniref:dual adapter for phosphotyrosine and 3-phosphotyrosine and 3-phosphoinositide-like n=1 Tax=Sycon ciliatum TaxID=27933 RepID=UPI0020A8594D|eukprot:scpid52544/ scgid13395/ Dual adapter for phosphotyrosine and 3-phosphotyrosine and 3-phosphoinositide; B lymphocyte adapter protein Bam32; B-cell adapter molecule of 32 kDa